MKQEKNSKFIGFMYLIRLNNCLMGVLSVIISAFIATKDPDYVKLGLSVATVFLVFAGGNIVNDLFDIETDRVNKPSRPLIAMNFNLRHMFVLVFVFLISGIILSAFISRTAFTIALISAVLLFLYSWSFKRLPFIGNLTISLLTGILFIFGAEAGGDFTKGIFPAIFSFFMNLGREITKDIEDVDGDEYAGMKTMPILIGKTKSFFIAAVVFVILIAITFIPYFNGTYNKWYFFITFFGVDIVLIVLLTIFYMFDDIRTKRFVNNYIKYDMIVGLAAIMMGAS